MINAAFSPASLRQLEATMVGYFDQFISGILLQAANNDGLVDLNQCFHNLAFDVHLKPITLTVGGRGVDVGRGFRCSA